MQKRAGSHLLFPSPCDPTKTRDHSAIRRRLTTACKALGLGHVTPHGLRSYFVTQARQSGLTDAEIAMLIGVTAIALAYRFINPDHLTYTFSNPAGPLIPSSASHMLFQATIAILVLVGFESVTAFTGEAKNPKDVPKAIMLSLVIFQSSSAILLTAI